MSLLRQFPLSGREAIGVTGLLLRNLVEDSISGKHFPKVHPVKMPHLFECKGGSTHKIFFVDGVLLCSLPLWLGPQRVILKSAYLN